MLFANDLIFLFPEIYWICLVICILLYGTFATLTTKRILIQTLGNFMVVCLLLFIYIYSQLPATDYMLLNYQYGLDIYAYFFRVALLFLVAVTVYLSAGYFFFERVFFTEYFFFIGLFCLSAFFLVSANEFTFFYLAIELQSLILYTLASLKRYNVFSAESGLKYFVLGALSSGLLLFGISLFYGFTGIINLYDVRFLMLTLFDGDIYAGVILSLLFVLAAFLFKLAAAPFHIWLPDVYEGAPTPVVMFFATLPKLSIIFFLIKFYLLVMADCSEIWHSAIFVTGVLSVLWGTFAALNQLNIKRLYAYSAIVNVGYLLIAMSYGTLEGFATVLNYLFPYILSTIAIFIVILIFRKAGTWRKIKFIADYKYYFAYSTPLAITVLLVFFSLAGIPPLAGFFTKFFLFRSVFLTDFLANSAVFIIILTSVISAFYYIRVVRFSFFYNIRSPLLFASLDLIGVFFLVFIVYTLLFFMFLQPTLLVSSLNMMSTACL